MGVIDVLKPHQYFSGSATMFALDVWPIPTAPTAPAANPGHFVEARTGCTYLTNVGPALAIALARALDPPTDLWPTPTTPEAKGPTTWQTRTRTNDSP